MNSQRFLKDLLLLIIIPGSIGAIMFFFNETIVNASMKFAFLIDKDKREQHGKMLKLTYKSVGLVCMCFSLLILLIVIFLLKKN